MEAIVGVGLAFGVILASLALVRGTCRLGREVTCTGDRSMAALWALECIAADLRHAGVGMAGAAGTDEAVELLAGGALGIRGDLDRDEPGEAGNPERWIAGPVPVATGNDEVLVFLRRIPNQNIGDTTAFWADMHGPDTVTTSDGTEVAKRDGAVERIPVGRAMRPGDDRSAVLYRVTFVNDATRFGTGRFDSAQPLLDRVTSFRVTGLDADGDEVGACGGRDEPSRRACRARVRRVALELTVEGATDVFRREVHLAARAD